jgi:hypothetical protein
MIRYFCVYKLQVFFGEPTDFIYFRNMGATRWSAIHGYMRKFLLFFESDFGGQRLIKAYIPILFSEYGSYKLSVARSVKEGV